MPGLKYSYEPGAGDRKSTNREMSRVEQGHYINDVGPVGVGGAEGKGTWANGVSWVRGFPNWCCSWGLAQGVSDKEHAGKRGRITLTGRERRAGLL